MAKELQETAIFIFFFLSFSTKPENMLARLLHSTVSEAKEPKQRAWDEAFLPLFLFNLQGIATNPGPH